MSFVVRDLVTSWRTEHPNLIPTVSEPRLDGVLDVIQEDLFRRHPQWKKRVDCIWAKRPPCPTCGYTKADSKGKFCRPCCEDRDRTREKLRMRALRAKRARP